MDNQPAGVRVMPNDGRTTRSREKDLRKLGTGRAIVPYRRKDSGLDATRDGGCVRRIDQPLRDQSCDNRILLRFAQVGAMANAGVSERVQGLLAQRCILDTGRLT